jgi:2-oxoglutarate ferredoxin oxidoreductase subunit beta
VFLVNNYIYGMTGGQVSPTTPHTNAEYPMNIAKLVAAAGANYVARWTTYQMRRLIAAMKEALQTKGFALVEIISQCPTSYGRRIGLRSGVAFLEYSRDHSVGIKKAPTMSEKALEGKIVVGKLVKRDRLESTESLRRINERAGAGSEA